MIAVTSLLIVMSVVRGWWLVLPAQGRGIGWIDIAAVLAFGGISVGLMLRGLPASAICERPMPEPVLPPARYEQSDVTSRSALDRVPG